MSLAVRGRHLLEGKAVVAVFGNGLGEVDAALVDSRRSACLEAAHIQTQTLAGLCQRACCGQTVGALVDEHLTDDECDNSVELEKFNFKLNN